jgi:hypothetical protein
MRGTRSSSAPLVTRTGRKTFGTADTVTVRVSGYPAPVTTDANFLTGDGD